MCPRTDLKVILTFSRNGELLCSAWLLKSFQQREGQRILSYSRNRVEIEAQKEMNAEMHAVSFEPLAISVFTVL